MNGEKKRLLYVFLGLAAGLLTLGCIELLFRANPSGYFLRSILQGVFLGSIFAFFFGIADGLLYRQARQALITGALAALIGAAAGGLSLVLTSQLLLWISSSSLGESAASRSFLLPVSRGIGWALVGMAIGGVDGLRTGAWRKGLAGVLGGFVGGFIGGMILEALVTLVPRPGLGRAIGLLALGGGIGFFLGEFERRFSFGRLRVLSGSHRNREYLLSRWRTNVGSGSRDDVMIPDYSGVAERHVAIVRRNEEIILETGASGKTKVNDRGLEGSHTLKYQDVIQIGSLKLLYLPL